MDSIMEEACHWLAKLDAGDLKDSEADSLSQWLHENNTHVEALIEMAELMDNMSVLSQLSEIIPLEMLSVSGNASSKVQKLRFGLAMPAFALVFVVIAVFFGLEIQQQKAEQLIVLEANTGIGEVKQITLVDGSKAILNTNTKINVEFDNRERNIVMKQGEAHFNVVPDSERPFIVTAGDSVIRAIGTAFNVRYNRDSIEVTVTEGIVEIESLKTLENTVIKQAHQSKLGKRHSKLAANLTAGQLAIAKGEIESLQTIDSITIEKKLAWQNGVVVFEGETLEQVVAEISRYTTISFIITDDEARTVRVGGYFEIGDIDKMLDVLKHGFNIGSTRNESGVIYLSRLNEGWR